MHAYMRGIPQVLVYYTGQCVIKQYMYVADYHPRRLLLQLDFKSDNQQTYD